MRRMIRRCVCPGSYDPVTNGHLDVIRRAADLYDEVVVAVLTNPAKPGAFTPPERIELLQEALAEPAAPAVTGTVRVVEVTRRLLVDFCRDVGAPVVVKGLRSAVDFDYELPMALMNRHLTGVETVFLPGDPRWQHVSSSLIREVVGLGGDVTGLVPEPVRLRLEQRLRGSPAG
jgi:pantetheine-phosphate adenylyltransferase